MPTMHAAMSALILIRPRTQDHDQEAAIAAATAQQRQARAALAAEPQGPSQAARPEAPEAGSSSQPRMNSNNQEQQPESSEEPKIKIKHVILRQEGEYILSQDAIATSLATELTSLEMDSTVASCRVMGKHGPYIVGLSEEAADRLIGDGYVEIVHIDESDTVEVELTVDPYDPKAKQVDPRQREEMRKRLRAELEQRRSRERADKEAKTVALMVDLPPEVTIQRDSNPNAVKWATGAISECLRDALHDVETINFVEAKTKLGAATGTVLCFIVFQSEAAKHRQPWHAVKWMIVSDRGIPPAKARFRRETRSELALTVCCFRSACEQSPCRARRQAERKAGVIGASLFGENERPPPPAWKIAAEERKRAREAEGYAEKDRLEKAARSPNRTIRECELFQQGACSRSSREELIEGRKKCQKKHTGWKVHPCKSSTEATFVCTWTEAMCPYAGHITKDPG
jgi:hypothetical protein